MVLAAYNEQNKMAKLNSCNGQNPMGANDSTLNAPAENTAKKSTQLRTKLLLGLEKIFNIGMASLVFVVPLGWVIELWRFCS